MHTRKILGIAAALAALGAGAGVALAGGTGGASSGASRMDDGKDLLPQAKLTEQQAIQAAQTVESGALNEVDLEHYQGRLVYNVDVGKHDVKVDASSGDVVADNVDD